MLVGYVAQYIVKPLLGLLVCAAFGVPPLFSSGLILTSCVAGAQLSSYAAFLSEGDVALSIILTSLTTITSVIITPLLTKLLIGSVVPVDVIAMSKSILQVIPISCIVCLGHVSDLGFGSTYFLEDVKDTLKYIFTHIIVISLLLLRVVIAGDL